MRRGRVLAAGLLPVLFTLPRFWNGFVFDDVFVIQRGEFIHQLTNLPRVFTAHAMVASSLDAAVGKPPMDTYRPISIGSFFLDAALSGREPWAYHLTNTLLHASVCMLLFAFLRRMVRAEPRALLVATWAFGLAPWLAEAHVWINGRSDLFLSLFVLLALLAQERALRERRWQSAVWAGVAMLCALWSKEFALVALPFVALVPCAPASGADALVPAPPTVQHPGLRQRVLYALPMLVALALYLVLRTRALDGMRTSAGSAHVLGALRNLPLVLADGVSHVLVPTPFALRNLRDDYATLPGWASPALATVEVLLAAALLWCSRHRRLAVWALALAVVTLAPATLISTELWPGFGRYLYFPALALFVALSDLFASVESPRIKRVLSLVAVTGVAFSAALLVDATLAMRDEQTMYTRSFQRAPEQAWTIGFLALSRKREGHCDEAVPLLAVAEGLAPDEPRYAVHLARCLVELGQFEHARNVAQRGQTRWVNTRAEPGFLIAEYLTLSPRDHLRAEHLIDRCLAIEPGRPDCLEARSNLRSDAR